MNNVTEDFIGFNVSPRTMSMLGRENISKASTAVLELIKNAYDADASRVIVKFNNASEEGGTIVIDDDGTGMDYDDLVKRWFLISTDNKMQSRKTRLGRTMVGEKGIGRLAINRLCQHTTLITHKKDSKQALRIDIDWSQYDDMSGQLHEIRHPLSVEPISSEKSSGTTLLMTVLRERWTADDYVKLHRDIAFLIPPYNNNISDFAVEFDCDEAPDLSGPVTSGMLDRYEYRIYATLSPKGIMRITLTHRSGKQVHDKRLWGASFSDSPPEAAPACGPIKFELYFYLRNKDKDIKRAEVDRFLNDFQGIRIYRDGMRIKPYGEPGGREDWLGLNARKIANPAGISRKDWVVSENQVVGGVNISKAFNPALIDQTNREGLIENPAFMDLRKFTLFTIEFFERERNKHYLEERNTNLGIEPASNTSNLALADEEIIEVNKQIRSISSALKETTDRIPAGSLFETQQVRDLRGLLPQLDKITDLTERISARLDDESTERQLLFGLSTLGIAMVTFGHETPRDVNNLTARILRLQQALSETDRINKTVIEDNIAALLKSAGQIEAWGKFALNRIRRDKRTRSKIDINEVISSINTDFTGLMERYNVEVTLSLSSSIPTFSCFRMDIEAILVNLFTNAAEALRFCDFRQIKIETCWQETIQVKFMDSGLGINDNDLDKVCNPLFSTKVDKDGRPLGTGMGLTIISDIVEFYNGHLEISGHGGIGGAEFTIFLPSGVQGANK